MKILVLSQTINEKYISLLEQVLGNELYIMTGSNINREFVYKTRPYDATCLMKRIHSWIFYYMDTQKLLKREKLVPDLVYAISNPPINSFIAYRLKKKYACKIVFMDWDIYPDIIERTFSNKLIQVICYLWHKANNYMFPKFDHILTIGEYMKKNIKAGIKNNINIDIVPMFTNSEKLKPIPKEENVFCMNYELINKIVVIYSGKMGLGHNMNIILNAAKILMEHKMIHFLLIGQGQQYKSVENRIQAENITNVTLLPFQSEEMFPVSLACGDIGIVSQEMSLADLFLPSKAYDMMAVGLPIIGICTEHDDLADLIKKKNIGEIISKNDAQILADMIKKFAEDKNLRNQYSYNSRRQVLECFDEKKVVNCYKEVLKNIV